MSPSRVSKFQVLDCGNGLGRGTKRETNLTSLDLNSRQAYINPIVDIYNSENQSQRQAISTSALIRTKSPIDVQLELVKEVTSMCPEAE